jgi:hypothetical protein
MQFTTKIESNSTYHAHKEIYGGGDLEKIATKSVAHWLAELQATKKDKQTDAMLFGSATHSVLLEKPTFNDYYFTYDETKRKVPTADFRNPENKQWKKDITKQAECKTLITPKLSTDINEVDTNVQMHPLASKILAKEGAVELSHYFEIDGIKYKIRPDKLIKDGNFYVSVKTTADIMQFGKSCYTYGYYVKEAFYMDMLRLMYPDIKLLIFILIENTAPFTVVVPEPIAYDSEWMEYGRTMYQKGMDRLKRYLDSKEVKSYDITSNEDGFDLLDISLPYWGLKQTGLIV